MTSAEPQIIASWKDDTKLLAGDTALIGAKAAGLLKLPRSWTPEFVVFTAEFYRCAQEAGGALAALHSLPREENELLQELLLKARAASGGQGDIYVRSNSPAETLMSRGMHRSLVSKLDSASIAEAIDSIIRRASGTMCILLQLVIQPALPGHMSNERRITADPKRWLVEGLEGDPRSPSQIVVASSIRTADEVSLLANGEQQILAALRRVAGGLARIGNGLHHCEWVWDARRIWVVQCDAADSAVTAAVSRTRAKRRTPKPFQPLSPILHFSQTSDVWMKLERPKRFRHSGLPAADVYFLTARDWVNNRAAAENGIRELCADDVVIRCDVSATAGHTDLLLPTSPASRDANKLFEFMDNETRAVQSRNENLENFAFLPARLVRARASAWVQAHPGGQYARVDAIWGYPDGLLHFAHDSYFYYFGSDEYQRHVRFKSKQLMPEEGGWVTKPVHPPHDWKRVLSDVEIRTVAEWARKMAAALNQQVQLMVLLRDDVTRGASACLPWHYTTLDIPRYDAAFRTPLGMRSVEVVRSWADLERLQASTEKPRGYQIQPAADLFRSEEFLEAVAAFAQTKNRPIYFEGSVLGHAYYVMARTGAEVIPVSEEPRADRRQYGKLVRDRIPLIIKRAGSIARVRRVAPALARELLLQKVVEEALELRSAPPSETIEELADIIEVLEALRTQARITWNELEDVRARKREQRGGFSEAIYLEQTELQAMRTSDDSGGAMPLFSDKGDGDSVARVVETARVRQESRRAESEICRLSLSLVPPIREIVGTPSSPELLPSLALSVRLELSNGTEEDAKAEIIYSDARIILVLSHAAHSAYVDPQPMLPFDLLDDPEQK